MADIYDDQFRRRVGMFAATCEPYAADIIMSLSRYLEREQDKVAELYQQRDAARDEVEVLKGELKAAEDGSGITNIQAQYEAQIEALTRRLSGQNSGN